MKPPKPIKFCSRCKKVGPFYLTSKVCKACNDTASTRWRHQNRDKHNATCKRKYEKNKERHKGYAQRRKLENPDAYWAEYTLSNAVKRGEVMRQEFCALCLQPCTTDAHHHAGYDKPLEVVWLCRSCHRQVHPGKKAA